MRHSNLQKKNPRVCINLPQIKSKNIYSVHVHIEIEIHIVIIEFSALL